MQKNQKLAETPPQSLSKLLLLFMGSVGVFCFFTVVAEDPTEFVVEICDYEEAVEAPDQAEVKKLRIHQSKEETDLSIFPNLRELHISFCEDLGLIKNIPSTIEILEIEDSAKVRIGLDDYKNLKRLAIRQCENASILGESSNVLEELSVEVCENLSFKAELNNTKKLTFLDTTFADRFDLNLARCDRLEDFQLRGCEKISLVGVFPKSLKKLHILSNGMVPFHLDLNACVNLEELSVSQEVTSIDFGKNSNLKSLQISGGKNFKLLGKLPKSLEYFDIFQVSFAEKTSINLKDYPRLRDVELSDCENFDVVR